MFKTALRTFYKETLRRISLRSGRPGFDYR